MNMRLRRSRIYDLAGELPEKRLAAGALLLSLLGLLLLLVYSQQQKPERLEISEIGSGHEGKLVEVVGSISSASARNGNIFINLCSSSCITVFIPSSSTDDFSFNPSLLQKGQRIAVRGIAREYKGEMEIVPVSDGLEVI
jgi:DNA/RNA endonuclease YhcR with UshA esterase domain